MQLLTPLMLAWFVWAAATAEPGFGPTGKRLIVVLATAMFVVASMPVATPYQFWVKRRIAAATPMLEARVLT
jgi:hypothetical protein